MLGDSCLCVDYDGPPAEFYDDKLVIARKEHVCCECGDAIKAGQKYERVVGKWDGMLEMYKTCMTCFHVRSSLMACGWHFGMVWEDIHEWFREQGIDPIDEETDESWLL